MKQLGDAARMHEVAEQPEKAAAIYIKIKSWGELAVRHAWSLDPPIWASVPPSLGCLLIRSFMDRPCASPQPLMSKIASPKLHSEYAKAKERCAGLQLFGLGVSVRSTPSLDLTSGSHGLVPAILCVR